MSEQKTIKKRAPQRRGIERRQKLMDSALALLKQKSFNELTYQEIADGAGIPLVSCYNFYGSKLDLVRALADLLTERYIDFVFSGQHFSQATDWRQCIAIDVNKTAEHHNKCQAELQIFFSGEVSFELRADSLLREQGIGLELLQVLSSKFVLPEIADIDKVLFKAIEIGRAMLSVGYQESGFLSQTAISDAVMAMTGYLGNYLSPILPLRSE